MLRVTPTKLAIPVTGGKTEMKLNNKGAIRFAFKILCSNNDRYRVGKIYGFIEPHGELSIKIQRLNSDDAKPKMDKVEKKSTHVSKNSTYE